jgi:primosomal protein DnaI
MDKQKFDEIGKLDIQKLDLKFDKAKQNKTFCLIAKSLQLKEDILKKYTSQIEDCAREYENCKNCKGLEYCKNDISGSMLRATKMGNGIEFSYVNCRYKNSEKFKDNMSLFNVPSSLKNANIKDIKLDGNRKEVLKEIQSFYKDYLDGKNPKGLYLVGDFGTGKSYIISALFNSLAKDGKKSVIVHTPELIRGIKESFDTDYSEKFDLLKNCDLLLLDDIGAEHITQWSRDEVIEPIIQYRMDEKLPTFFTSNFDYDGLEKHFTINGETVYAKRIIERIKFLSKEVQLRCKNFRE